MSSGIWKTASRCRAKSGPDRHQHAICATDYQTAMLGRGRAWNKIIEKAGSNSD